MIKINRYIQIFILLLVAGNTTFTNGEDLNKKSIVAVVEGVDIEYKKVPEDQIIFLFKLVKGHKPETEAEMLEVEKEREDKEKEIIVSKIKGVIYNKQRERFGIEITGKEVAKNWNSRHEGTDFDEAARKLRNYYIPLLSALNLVYEEGEDKDAVYNKMLADKMTKLEWEIRHYNFRTLEMRKVLEDATKRTGDDLRKPNVGIRPMVERKEINKYIDREILNKDPEFAEYKTLLEDDPKNKKLQQFNPNYLDIKRGLWWQEQYKKAKIEIKDDRFKGVLQMLMPNVKGEKSIK